VINGKKTPFEIEYKYAKSETAKNTALIIKEDMDKVGIKFDIVEKEWTVYVQELDKFDFDMYSIGFTINPRVSDPKQQWHTSSAVPGGSNNVGWGNAETDKMIETLISDLNPENRNKIYMDLQQRIHDDVPVIFLFSPKNRMAVNKNFSIEKIMISPGFLYNEFKLVK
jgi:ABC-type transport system substrate-binding protein